MYPSFNLDGIVDGNVLCIWTGDGPLKSWNDQRTLDLVVQSQPAAVMLHFTPARSQVYELAKVTELVRQTIDAEVWWEVAGDWGEETKAPERWEPIAKIAQENEISAFVINAEMQWDTPPEAKAARRAVELMRTVYKGKIGHTAFDGPVGVPRHPQHDRRNWGGHGYYPWEPFLGTGGCDFSIPQVYFGNRTNRTPFEYGDIRYERHCRSWKAAIDKGWIRPDLPTGVYLLSYGCNIGALCHVAQMRKAVAWWAVPIHDSHGRIAILASQRIRYMGYRWDDTQEEPNGIKRLQADLGCLVDGWVGPETLGAIGLSVG